MQKHTMKVRIKIRRKVIKGKCSNKVKPRQRIDSELMEVAYELADDGI